MELTLKDLHRLLYIERWLTYRMADGELSLDNVIRQDGGKNFSTILKAEDTKVKSFTMKNLPEADFLLVCGSSPRAVCHVAEAAVVHRNKYGRYPEFIATDYGNEMLASYRPSFEYTDGNVLRVLNLPYSMAELFRDAMIQLGFSSEWVLRHKMPNFLSDMEALLDLIPLIRSWKNGIKPKVLVFDASGYSLRSAMDIPMVLPYADFWFFESPQPKLEERIFDCERFAPDTYAVDALLANIFYVRAFKGGNGIPLPVEKLLCCPQMRYVKSLLQQGYVGCFRTSEMWTFAGLSILDGLKASARRGIQLGKVIHPDGIEDQMAEFLKRVRQRFSNKGLVVR